jgi:hypothetical protein
MTITNWAASHISATLGRQDQLNRLGLPKTPGRQAKGNPRGRVDPSGASTRSDGSRAVRQEGRADAPGSLASHKLPRRNGATPPPINRQGASPALLITNGP